MKIVASQAHHLHAPSWDLGPGRFLPAFEKPERAEIVLESLEGSQRVRSSLPCHLARTLLLRSHDADYLDFLKTVSCWVSRNWAWRVIRRPVSGQGAGCGQTVQDSIVAKFGRYCFDGGNHADHLRSHCCLPRYRAHSSAVG